MLRKYITWKLFQDMETRTSIMNTRQRKSNNTHTESWLSVRSFFPHQMDHARTERMPHLWVLCTIGLDLIWDNMFVLMLCIVPCSIDAWRSSLLQNKETNGCHCLKILQFMDAMLRQRLVMDLMSPDFWQHLLLIRRRMNLLFILRNQWLRNGGLESLEDRQHMLSFLLSCSFLMMMGSSIITV